MLGALLFSATLLPAFPGAEGAGAGATGGRGGRVIAVTTLADAGPGSLRAAVEAEGPRTVVFRVAGTIELKKKLGVKHGDLTLAGQTAPGGGICVKGFGLSLAKARNVIVRHLRFRPGDGAGVAVDALGGTQCEDIIIDHCSASWSVDETVSFYDGQRITVQWCVIAESLFRSAHTKGEHGYGGIWGGTPGSWHHNLLAHHTSRNPRIEREEAADVRNNVIFNWGFNSIYGGERSTVNLVGNYFQPGPATQPKVRDRMLDASGEGGRWFLAGNLLAGAPDLEADPWQGAVQRPWTRDATKLRAPAAFPAAWVTTHSAAEARELVLAGAGATRPQRDAVDARIVQEVRDGVALSGRSYLGGWNGIIDSPADVGGWPELAAGEAPADGDGDGMPDAWETAHGLAPGDASDGPRDTDRDGYTNVEEFLNSTDPRQFVDYRIPRELPPQTFEPKQPAFFWRDEIVVAADGKGDFTTVEAAIAAAPLGRARPLLIRIRAGVPHEGVSVPADKPYLTLKRPPAPQAP
jgi:pectate lyase